jgi:hypothetical protein
VVPPAQVSTGTPAWQVVLWATGALVVGLAGGLVLDHLIP